MTGLLMQPLGAGLGAGSMALAGLCLGVGVGGAAALGAVLGAGLVTSFGYVSMTVMGPNPESKPSGLTITATMVMNLFLTLAATFLMAQGLGLGLSIGTFAALSGITVGFILATSVIGGLIFRACKGPDPASAAEGAGG